jgi:putative hemolysin
MVFVEIAIVLLLVSVNGLLAMSELALVASRPAVLQGMIEKGTTGARRALALAKDRGKFLSTVQIGITLVGILAGAFSGATLADRLGDWLAGEGLMASRVAEPLAVAITVSAITYLSLVAGELVPKQLALRNPEAVAVRVAPAMTVLAAAGGPLVRLLDASTQAVLRLFGARPQEEQRVTDEEIRLLIAEAETAGVLEPEEREMIAGVMRLADRSVRGVMTPRRDVVTIDLRDEPDEIRRRIMEAQHSRLPVIDGDADEIVGIVQAKDMLDACIRGEPIDPRKHLRQAPVILDILDAIDVVGVLKASPVHLGLVYDEYGNFEGVVTTADILEAIVGAFRDEQTLTEPDMVTREDGSFLVSGAMPADELAEKLRVSLPDDRDYSTAAGLVLNLFQRLPEIGEKIDMDGWRFEVIDLDGRRIDKLLVGKAPDEERASGTPAEISAPGP